MPDKHVVLLINLLQDVNVARPIAILAAKELNFRTAFFVSTRFTSQDPDGRWMRELREISESGGIQLFVFDSTIEALQLLEGKCGVLVAASESNLAAHAITHNVFRAAPPAFVKITLQHGFEGVGFLHSREHDKAHGTDVTFAADILCGWFDGTLQKSMLPSQRPKLHVTGPSIALHGRQCTGPASDMPSSSSQPSEPKTGIVCETLHSIRFSTNTDMRGDFAACFEEFCHGIRPLGEKVVLRPHPAGRFFIRNGIPLPDNAELSTEPIYKVDLARYAYGISTGSSVLIDMILAGIPVAVWRDASRTMDVSAYAGLAEVTTVQDWLDFAREASLRPDGFIERQRQFLERHRMPTAPSDVRRRFATVLHCAATAMAPPRLPQRGARERVLCAISGASPALKKVFGGSLGALLANGEFSVQYLSDHDRVLQFGPAESPSSIQRWVAARSSRQADRLWASASTIRGWVAARLEVFDPTMLVMENDGGLHADLLIEHALHRKIPIVQYLDHQALVPTGTATDLHNGRALDRLLNVADVISGSAGQIQAASQCAAVPRQTLRELSEWDLRPRRLGRQAPAPFNAMQDKVLSIFEAARKNRVSRRILAFAPGNLPTFQLSFAKPFSLPRAQGEITYDLVTAQQIRKVNKDGTSPEAEREWIADRIRSFAPTVIVLCRYAGPHQDLILDLAKQAGIPTVFHIDDDLLNVPTVLGEKKAAIHNAAPRLEAIRQLLDESDLVYCSTAGLKRKFESTGARAPLKAGEIYCAGHVIAPAVLRPVRKVGYMASADHSHNLAMILPAIVEFLRRNPTITFEFFGSIPCPAALDEFRDRIRTAPPITDYERFLEEFSKLEWDIGICPLSPIDFNLSKANTKWVEYTSVGAAVVASRDTVYNACCADECGLLASNSEEWLTALETLALDPVARFEQVKRAQQRLTNDYSLERLYAQVLDMFDHAAMSRNADRRTAGEKAIASAPAASLAEEDSSSQDAKPLAAEISAL